MPPLMTRPPAALSEFGLVGVLPGLDTCSSLGQRFMTLS